MKTLASRGDCGCRAFWAANPHMVLKAVHVVTGLHCSGVQSFHGSGVVQPRAAARRDACRRMGIIMPAMSTVADVNQVRFEPPPVAAGSSFYDSVGRPVYIAAPMVEQSELAFRTLVRRHGCQLAFTPMINSRHFGPPHATKVRQQHFDGMDDDLDRPLVAQFCASNKDDVVQAASYVQHQVDAVDLNLGCPQKIARKGGYGAYLLEHPQRCEGMVAHMVRSLECPVTVKMRCLPSLEDTLELAKRLEAAGAQMLTVHGRTLHQAKTTQGLADWDAIARVKQALSIPVIANGGIETIDDVHRCLRITGADGVMSSEALLENPALFDLTMPPLHTLGELEQAHRQLSLTLEYLDIVKSQPRMHMEAVKLKGHLFKMLHRMLSCQHDLRGQLGQPQVCKHEEMLGIVRELAARYHCDPDSRTSLVDPAAAPPVALGEVSWYRRHRKEEALTS